MINKEKRSVGAKIAIFAVCLLIVIVYFFPIYLLVNVSFREKGDLTSRLALTLEPHITSYKELFSDGIIWRCFLNTIIYTAFEILFLIPLASIGGYGLARSQNWFSAMIRSFNILVMMIPGVALLVGTYGLMVKMKLTNNLIGLALLGAGGGMTGGMFFYTTFTSSIPIDLDEAAMIDGAGVIRTYFRIIFPQLKAITITRVIGIVTGCWNNYLMPMYMLTKQENFTILMYVRKLFGSGRVPNVPLSFAGALVMVLPILVFYFLMQKHIVGGQLDSAVKG